MHKYKELMESVKSKGKSLEEATDVSFEELSVNSQQALENTKKVLGLGALVQAFEGVHGAIGIYEMPSPSLRLMREDLIQITQQPLFRWIEPNTQTQTVSIGC